MGPILTPVSVLTAILHVDLGQPVTERLHSGFFAAKGDAVDCDNWSYKSCKASVKSSPPTNQHPMFYRPDVLPVAQLTNLLGRDEGEGETDKERYSVSQVKV